MSPANADTVLHSYSSTVLLETAYACSNGCLALDHFLSFIHHSTILAHIRALWRSTGNTYYNEKQFQGTFLLRNANNALYLHIHIRVIPY